MKESLVNSIAEGKLKKGGNTAFEFPASIGKISMVVNGNSDAFSWTKEKSDQNSNKHNIASQLSRKPYYNFNDFSSGIPRKVLDKVEFDINDSEDSVEEKLSKSDSIKKPFKFSTYLRSSRQGKMFGSFALDQGAFLGIEYTEVNRGCVSTITVERKELRVKLGRSGIFSTLEDASNDTATSGTASEITEDKVPNLLKNIKNYTNSNKLYIPFFKNDNTFVREMAQKLNLNGVAWLHSSFTAGSAANRVQNCYYTKDEDYSKVRLKQYLEQDKFKIYYSDRRDILKKLSSLGQKKHAAVMGRMRFDEYIADAETGAKTHLKTSNSGDEDEKRKQEFIKRGEKLQKKHKDERKNGFFRPIVPPAIALPKRTREDYEKYKEVFYKNFSIDELKKVLNSSQIPNYNKIIDLDQESWRTDDARLVKRLLDRVCFLENDFKDTILAFLEAPIDSIIKYGEFMEEKEKDECFEIYQKMISTIQETGIILKKINKNTFELKEIKEKGKEVEEMRSKKYLVWPNYEACKKDFFEEKGSFSIAALEEELDLQSEDYMGLLDNSEKLKNTKDEGERKELRESIDYIKSDILGSIKSLVINIPYIVEKYNEEIVNKNEKALWKDAFTDRMNLIKSKGWDLKSLGISEDFNYYLEK